MAIDPVSAGVGAAGTWLWEQFGKELTGKLLGVARERWDKFNWSKAAERYKDSLRAQLATIRILGKSDPVPLEGIFTDVYILDEVTARLRYDIEELRKAGGDRIEFGRQSQKRHAGLALIKRGDNFFVLGKPGAGKTTFLRYITLQAIDGSLDKIPIFLSLHAWSMAGEDTLMPFIVRQFDICNFPDAQLFIDDLLASGKAIVLFDGLDEVKVEDDRRQRLTLLLNDFAKKYRHSQVLITCRIAASEYQFDGFRDVELADFTREQIHSYARKWFGTDTTKYQAFIKELYEQRNAGLRELGTNPLLLSMLCLAFDRTMRYPDRRAELFDDATEALLERLDATRGIARDAIYRRMTRQQKVRLLAVLASEAFEKGQYFLERRWLVPRITTYMKSLPGADREDEIDGDTVLDAIEAQHGLLVERASDIYAYAHLSFQEYFTAKYIVDNEARGAVKRLIHSHLTDNRWREVFLLTASMLGNADDFFAEIRQATDRFILNYQEIVNLLVWAEQRATQNKSLSQPTLRAIYIFVALMSAGEAVSDLDGTLFAHALQAVYGLAHTNVGARDSAVLRAYALVRDGARDRALALVLARNLEFIHTLNLKLDLKDVLRLRAEHYSSLISYLQAIRLISDCLKVAFVSDRQAIHASILSPPKPDPDI